MRTPGHTRGQLQRLSDAELVELTREGDGRAYEVLWERHRKAARAVAQAFTNSFEPDDLVSEAYLQVLRSIRDGGGPTIAFRAYLLRAVRNIAVSWQRKPQIETIEDADLYEDPATSDESVLAGLERGIVAVAFRSLPRRWQEVLWYVEVEGMKSRDIAPLMGLRPNAVAALTYRAREGLRQAWIQAHLVSVAEDSEHKWVIDRLGAYIRRGLGKADRRRLDAHLGECPSCAAIAAEAQGAGSQLSVVLLFLGLAAVGTGVHVAGVRGEFGGAEIATLTASAQGVRQSGGRFTRTNRVRVALAGLLVAGVSAAVLPALLAPALIPPEVPREWPGIEAGRPTVVPSPPGMVPSPSASATDTPDTPASVSGPGAGPSSTPAPGPVSSAPAPSVSVSVSISTIDTGSGWAEGLLYPIVTGVAQPYATLTVSNGTARPVTVVAEGDGRWQTPPLTGASTGRITISVWQSASPAGGQLPDATRTVEIGAPPQLTVAGGAHQFAVAVVGLGMSGIETFADATRDWGSSVLGPDGKWDATYQWFTSPGTHQIGVRYRAGSRYGPTRTVEVAIAP